MGLTAADKPADPRPATSRTWPPRPPHRRNVIRTVTTARRAVMWRLQPDGDGSQTTPMWIAPLFTAVALSLSAVAMWRLTRLRRRATDYLTVYGWPHQALWAGVGAASAASAAANAASGRPWLAAGDSAVTLIAVVVAAQARYHCRSLVRAEQEIAKRLLRSHRARRVDVPVTDRARLTIAPDGALQVLYPAVWPPSPIGRALTRRPPPPRRGDPPPAAPRRRRNGPGR